MAGDAMSERDRDLVDQAMSIIDNTTLLLPERAHLVALHRYHVRLLNQRVTQLLRLLEAEHVHEYAGKVGPCLTCRFIASQPEWAEMNDDELDKEFGSL